jgi:hypothetical protein
MGFPHDFIAGDEVQRLILRVLGVRLENHLA